MNYFGLIFTFMLPGMIVGGMAAALIYEAKERRRAKKRHERCHRPIKMWYELKAGDDR